MALHVVWFKYEVRLFLKLYVLSKKSHFSGTTRKGKTFRKKISRHTYSLITLSISSISCWRKHFSVCGLTCLTDRSACTRNNAWSPSCYFLWILCNSIEGISTEESSLNPFAMPLLIICKRNRRSRAGRRVREEITRQLEESVAAFLILPQRPPEIPPGPQYRAPDLNVAISHLLQATSEISDCNFNPCYRSGFWLEVRHWGRNSNHDRNIFSSAHINKVSSV